MKFDAAEIHKGDGCSCRGTLRHLHPFEPDADGDCRRCEFGADETEVHVPAGETIIGFINPDGSGEGNWAWASAQSDSDAWVLNNSRWAEKEWARLRADGFSESELRERSGAQ